MDDVKVNWKLEGSGLSQIITDSKYKPGEVIQHFWKIYTSFLIPCTSDTPVVANRTAVAGLDIDYIWYRATLVSNYSLDSPIILVCSRKINCVMYGF